MICKGKRGGTSIRAVCRWELVSGESVPTDSRTALGPRRDTRRLPRRPHIYSEEAMSTDKQDVSLDTVQASAEPETSSAVSAPSRTRRWLRDLAEVIVFGLFAFALVQLTIQNFEIDGPSMQTTLKPGERVLTYKLAFVRVPLDALPIFQDGDRLTAGNPGRGDVVVLRSPNGSQRDLIKRIVALPGETIEVSQRGVFVDGVPLDEPYVSAPANYAIPARTVPADHYFVLGDNRSNSSDSHVWGMLPRDNIIGRALLVYWPPGEWGTALAHDYAQ